MTFDYDIDIPINPNRKLYIAMAKKDTVDYVYNTSALEGNAMTYPEVQTLLEGITVGGHKLGDENMILNQNRSMKLLFELLDENRFDDSKRCICMLHKQVAKEEALTWGKFRVSNVRIGGTEFLPPPHDKLDDIWTKNTEVIRGIKHPIIGAFHNFLLNCRTQYFFDGNKRTARLMMNGKLLDSGYPMLNIKASDKLEFNRMMIDYYDSDDIEVATKWLLDYYKKHSLEYL